MEAAMSNIPDSSNVFVVHGRNLRAKKALFEFLRALGLHPIEWARAVKATGHGSPHVGEVLDAGLSLCQAVVVLMTPDDVGYVRERFYSSDDSPEEVMARGQPRLNVIFEAGMALGRFPDRTIIVELGRLRPFSDIGGRHTIRINDTPEKREELRERLESAGCEVKAGTDWLKAGIFSEPIKDRFVEWNSDDVDRHFSYLLDPDELEQAKRSTEQWEDAVHAYILLSAIQHSHDVLTWFRRNTSNPVAIPMLLEMVINSPHNRPAFRAAKLLELFDRPRVIDNISDVNERIEGHNLTEKARLLLEAIPNNGVEELTRTTKLLETDPRARGELLHTFRYWPKHSWIRLDDSG
jgi:predicted nucleotide-binding protein